jgi:uncharacterized protein (UPF0276 family)
VGGRNLHDLMPLPYTEEVVRHVAGRIRQVQEILERTILVVECVELHGIYLLTTVRVGVP